MPALLLDCPAPSPKFHDHTVLQVPTGIHCDVSVNWKTVVFLKPPDGLTVKLATGAKHGTGVGVGEAVGAGVGVGPVPVGVGLGVGDGDGEGEGVGVGVAVGAAPATGGSTMIWAVAVEVSVTSLPPMNGARIGVSSLKCPRTVTVTVLAMSFAQPGLQATETSAFWTWTNEPLDSLRTRHMIRLSAALQDAFGWNEVGL